MITIDRDNFSEGFAGSVSGKLTAKDKPSLVTEAPPFRYTLVYFIEGKDLTFDGKTMHESGKDTVRIVNEYSLSKNNGYFLTVESGLFISLGFMCSTPVFPMITVIDASKNAKIKDLFLKIDLICKQRKPNYYLKAASLFFTLLSELIETENSAGSPKRFKNLDKAVKYIHDHYLEPDFFCGCLPDICGIKHSYFNRLFAEKYHKSPSKYVNELRMGRAADLLMSQKYSIDDISRKTGYDNPNYFSRVFKSFYGVAPSNYNRFTKTQTLPPIQEHFDENDKKLCEMLVYDETMKDIRIGELSLADNMNTFAVSSAQTGAQHPSVTCFNGKIFVFWSFDGAVYAADCNSFPEFSKALLITQSPDPDIIYSYPTCYVCDGRLYVTASKTASDNKILGIDIFIYNEETGKFDYLKDLEYPFIPTSDACAGDNGVLMLPGKAAVSLEGKPDIPAVLISYSGKFDGDWSLCYVQSDNRLPDGTCFDSPDCSVFTIDKTNYLFCRNDRLNVPIIYVATNYFDWWSPPQFHNIPFSPSPLCSGTLSDGRNYIIGNIYPGTSKLALFFSKPYEHVFSKAFLIMDGKSSGSKTRFDSWFSPSAVESDGKLYVIYSASKTYDLSDSNIIISEIYID